MSNQNDKFRPRIALPNAVLAKDPELEILVLKDELAKAGQLLTQMNNAGLQLQAERAEFVNLAIALTLAAGGEVRLTKAVQERMNGMIFTLSKEHEDTTGDIVVRIVGEKPRTVETDVKVVVAPQLEIAH